MFGIQTIFCIDKDGWQTVHPGASPCIRYIPFPFIDCIVKMLTLDILAWVGNVLNVAYNIPQVVVVLKHRTGSNISSLFLQLRLLASIVWIVYAELKQDHYIAGSYCVTGLCTGLILGVKIHARQRERERHERQTVVI